MYDVTRNHIHGSTRYECPICDDNSERYHDGISEIFMCPTCGKFRTYYSATQSLRAHEQQASHQRGISNSFLYKVSYVTRSITEKAGTQSDPALFPIYGYEDFQEMMQRPAPTVQEKSQQLLRFIATASVYPGNWAYFDSQHDYSVICARNEEEALFVLESLAERGLAELRGTTNPRAYKVTATGWTELDRLQQTGADSHNAFIAMWFDATRKPYDEAIQRAVAAAGYRPVRIDQVEHLNRIDDEIIARIRDSKFLIADVTGQRNGVYFEAGFMIGLGRPVIWLCDKSDLERVHFDTRQYNTIVYTDEQDIESRLRFRIEANLGKGLYRQGME